MKKMRLGKTRVKLLALYKKVMEAFVDYSIDGKLKFKQAKHILSWLFHLHKKECWKVLKELENLDAIKIVPNHFIKLNLSKANFFMAKMEKK